MSEAPPETQLVAVGPDDDTPTVPLRALIPRVTTIAAPRLSLEVVAIAAAVFAVVQCLLVLVLPAELLWMVVLALAASRVPLRESGHDRELAPPWWRRRHKRGSVLRACESGRR